MTPNEYQQLTLRTEKTPEFIAPGVVSNVDTRREAEVRARLLHAALGVGTEAGELQDVLKKHLMYGRPLDEVNIVEECGDALWYISLALAAIGVSLEHCMEKNIEKLRVRFPDKFTEERAVTRDLEAEARALRGE